MSTTPTPSIATLPIKPQRVLKLAVVEYQGRRRPVRPGTIPSGRKIDARSRAS